MSDLLAHGLIALGGFGVLFLAARVRWSATEEASGGSGLD